MGGQDLGQDVLAVGPIDPALHRRLAIHCADRIGTQHPTEWDDTDPVRAARDIAKDPTVRTALRELLDAIGYTSKEQT
jgi:hypothetical protein